MARRIKALLFLLLFLLLLGSGCPRGDEKSGEKSSSGTPLPPELEQMENVLLEIMQQADLLPLVEQSQSSGEKSREQKPTFDQTTLGEVLNREMQSGEKTESKLPADGEQVWNSIKMNIVALHGQWDKLEPKLREQNIPRETVAAYEEELDSLTLAGTSRNEAVLLEAANRQTLYLSRFRMPFSGGQPPLLGELRYYVRSIVLNSAGGDFAGAQEELGLIREQLPALTKELAVEETAGLEISLENLQRALDKEDLNLVKIKAAELMDKLVQSAKQSG
ncbi:MAG: hypothetical protein GX210_01055 [Firmicutes bacterium]|nr:hypothetical protein [Bacillota bacterium]